MAIRLCSLIAYFATFDANAPFRLASFYPSEDATVAKSPQCHAVVASLATAFLRPVRHRLYDRETRQVWQSSARIGRCWAVRAAVQSFDELCSTVLAMKSIQNSKCRIQNVRSFFFSLRLDNDTGQDFDQFFAFLQQGSKAAFRNELRSD